MNAVPSGTVVFFFSDIEGSTTRWDTRREAMREAVRRHDAVVRGAIERHEGYIFKTLGDAFCAAFSTVDAALNAAAQAQRELAGEDWSAVDGLRVRIAIHAGDADERDGDYFGPAVNRVARLVALGHGGQVLVSSVAAQLAASRANGELELVELGTFSLKDLREPERVFQLAGPGLPREFKPLTGSATPGNLPRATTSFVGRDEDARRLAELMRVGGLATIVGTGGVGKTRLALYAAEHTDGVRDGKWLIELAPLTDGALIPGTILASLGGVQTDAGDALDALTAHLRERRILIVLDNCEHVVGDVARTAAAILAQCPGVTLLATSREPLGVPGERTYRLPSLELAAAVELFADRAAAANPAFTVDARTRGSVERICERLDGIALAIELAAARLRAISVEELSQRLTDRFRVLTGGSRTALPRQQTMRALIDWSYDTLGDDEKAVFRRLSVFTGGWSLEAAAAVAGDDALDEWAVLDCVSQLVDKSLVVATVTGATQRYAFLQSIAEYAAEQLGAAGERAAREERHARYYAGVAQRAYREWDVGARPGWLAELTPERDNLRAALGWSLEERGDATLGARLAADIAPAMMRFAPPSEAIRWCLAALPEARDAPELEARLQYALSMLYNNQASYTSALAAAERAADLSAQIDDDRASVRTFSQLAQQYARQGRHADALTCAQRSLDAARRLGDQPLLAATLQRCANVFKPREIDRARAQFKESVALFRSLERTEDTARALTFWAAAEAHAGSFEEAIALSQEALALGAHETQLYLTNNVACCAVAAGRDDLALTAARQTLQLAVASGHAAIAANAIVYLATLSAAADPARSAKLLAYASARRASLGYERDELDDLIERRASAALAERLPETELQPLQAAGALWSEDDALRAAAAI